MYTTFKYFDSINRFLISFQKIEMKTQLFQFIEFPNQISKITNYIFIIWFDLVRFTILVCTCFTSNKIYGSLIAIKKILV